MGSTQGLEMQPMLETIKKEALEGNMQALVQDIFKDMKSFQSAEDKQKFQAALNKELSTLGFPKITSLDQNTQTIQANDNNRHVTINKEGVSEQIGDKTVKGKIDQGHFVANQYAEDGKGVFRNSHNLVALEERGNGDKAHIKYGSGGGTDISSIAFEKEGSSVTHNQDGSYTLKDKGGKEEKVTNVEVDQQTGNISWVDSKGQKHLRKSDGTNVDGDKVTPATPEAPKQQTPGNSNDQQPAANSNDQQPAGKSNDQQPAGKSNDQQPAGKSNDQQPAGKSNDQQPAGKSNDQQPANQSLDSKSDPLVQQISQLENAGTQAMITGNNELAASQFLSAMQCYQQYMNKYGSHMGESERQQNIEHYKKLVGMYQAAMTGSQ